MYTGHEPSEIAIREPRPAEPFLIPVHGSTRTYNPSAPVQGAPHLALLARNPGAFALRVWDDECHLRARPGDFLVLFPKRVPSPGDELGIVTGDAFSLRALVYLDEQECLLERLDATRARELLPRDQITLLGVLIAIVQPSGLIRRVGSCAEPY